MNKHQYIRESDEESSGEEYDKSSFSDDDIVEISKEEKPALVVPSSQSAKNIPVAKTHTKRPDTLQVPAQGSWSGQQASDSAFPYLRQQLSQPSQPRPLLNSFKRNTEQPQTLYPTRERSVINYADATNWSPNNQTQIAQHMNRLPHHSLGSERNLADQSFQQENLGHQEIPQLNTEWIRFCHQEQDQPTVHVHQTPVNSYTPISNTGNVRQGFDPQSHTPSCIVINVTTQCPAHPEHQWTTSVYYPTPMNTPHGNERAQQ